MTTPSLPDNTELDTILTKAFNDFYDYITEKDIIKVSHEYSEKSIYKDAKAALEALFAAQAEHLLAEIEAIVLLAVSVAKNTNKALENLYNLISAELKSEENK